MLAALLFWAASVSVAIWLDTRHRPQPPETQGDEDMSITGYQPGSIKARLEAMKQKAAADRNGALAELDAAAAKHEEVTSEIKRIAAQEKKEAEDALQEFAQFTNGAPAADPQNGAAANPKTNPPPMPSIK